MNIRLRPEPERLVEEDVQRGPYQTADEFVERALVFAPRTGKLAGRE